MSEKNKEPKKVLVEKVTLADKAKYKAKEGCLLPIFYEGKIVRIEESKQIELDKKKLSYESKVELIRSIKKGHVIVG